MKRTGWLLLALLALGCEEEETTATAQEPAPVTPVEVTTGEGAQTEVEQLRARVAELEQQLATCQQAQPATQTATIPEGVDVPAGETPPATPPATQTATAENEAHDAGTARNRRRRDPTLMDTILGDDGRRRRQGDDETIEVPNPANILLGN